MKKSFSIIAAALAMLLLAGCAENPDSDIIVHKDMDKVIDEAQQNGENSKYWEWQNELSCKETVTLRNADNTAVLYVQNNPNYSNKIFICASPAGVQKNIGVTVETEPLNAKNQKRH